MRWSCSARLADPGHQVDTVGDQNSSLLVKIFGAPSTIRSPSEHAERGFDLVRVLGATREGLRTGEVLLRTGRELVTGIDAADSLRIAGRVAAARRRRPDRRRC
jgi:hypothetical protein